MSSHNTEKVVYFLLLDRKLRNPSKDDEEDIKAKSECGKLLPSLTHTDISSNCVVRRMKCSCKTFLVYLRNCFARLIFVLYLTNNINSEYS